MQMDSTCWTYFTDACAICYVSSFKSGKINLTQYLLSVVNYNCACYYLCIAMIWPK